MNDAPTSNHLYPRYQARTSRILEALGGSKVVFGVRKLQQAAPRFLTACLSRLSLIYTSNQQQVIQPSSSETIY